MIIRRLAAVLGLAALAACAKDTKEASNQKGRLEVHMLAPSGAKGDQLANNKSLRFSDTAVGTVGKLVVVVTNAGPGPLKVQNPSLVSRQVGSNPVPELNAKPLEPCPGRQGSATDLASGQCSRLTVEFSPAAIGAYVDTLTLENDGSGGEFRLQVSADAARAKPKGAGGEYGVTPTEVVIGQAAAFTGPSAGLGIEVWRGAAAAFEEINAAGGIHGRRVTLKVADDGYEEGKALGAALKLVNEDEVFALFSGVGTPTIAKVLPVVKRYFDDEKLFYFASFTGAAIQRESPYDRVAFNVRASYAQEADAMVRALAEAGKKKVAVFYQDDGYGKSGLAGVKRALEFQASKPVATALYPRGLQYDQSMEFHLAELKKGDPDAIICIASYQAAAALIRDVRNSGWNIPIFNVSFVGADQMVKMLRAEEEKTKKKYVVNIFNSQVVPPYSAAQNPFVKQYRAAMDRFKPAVPATVPGITYQPAQAYTYGSLEGYLNARVFATVLEKAGPKLTREAFIAAAEGMGKFDLGLGSSLEFSPTRHQALEQVWLTQPEGTEWRIIEKLPKNLK